MNQFHFILLDIEWSMWLDVAEALLPYIYISIIMYTLYVRANQICECVIIQVLET